MGGRQKETAAISFVKHNLLPFFLKLFSHDVVILAITSSEALMFLLQRYHFVCNPKKDFLENPYFWSQLNVLFKSECYTMKRQGIALITDFLYACP